MEAKATKSQKYVGQRQPRKQCSSSLLQQTLLKCESKPGDHTAENMKKPFPDNPMSNTSDCAASRTNSDSGIVQDLTTSGASAIVESNSKDNNPPGRHDNEEQMDNSPARNSSSGEESSNAISSDYGYPAKTATTGVLENIANQHEQSNSTSSNDDQEAAGKRTITPHTSLQKPRPKKSDISASEKRELRREILILRSKSRRRKVKAIIHFIPTDQDITEVLTEFLVDFLLKGFSGVVNAYRQKMLSGEPEPQSQMDQSHFLWLFTYFLKFAVQLEVEVDQIR